MQTESNTWLESIQNFADKLTLKRLLTVLLSGILITLITMAYENRNAVFTAGFLAISEKPQTSWTVSQESQSSLVDLVQKSNLVKLISISEVDLQKNRRTIRFWHLNDPAENKIRAKLSNILPQPVFDYNQKNTAQMVAILNNEFSCSRFEDTSYGDTFPELTPILPVVCRIAIPPFYGRFVGILTIGLSAQPTKNELDTIRLEASRLAVEVYLREVIKKPVS